MCARIMKIVFIITNLETGGAERMLYKILQHIDRSYFKPTVISLMGLGDIGQSIIELGIPVHTLNLKQGSIPGIFTLYKLVKLLRFLEVDIIHTWMYHADLIGGLAGKLAGVRRIVWGIRHSNLSPNLNKKSTLIVVKLCAYLSSWIPTGILSCSHKAMKIHYDAGYSANKIDVIPNGFDLSNYIPDHSAKNSLCEELRISNDVKLVGLIGRYDPQKNHSGFIRAAEIISRYVPNVHFILAGAGVNSDNVSLMVEIQQAELVTSFHLLGRRDDIPRLMCSLDVLASSSDGEAFPNVLGEAMACGVPCVVTDVGDCREIVGCAGRVVLPGDMEELAKEVVSILLLPSFERHRLSEQARRNVAENYEISQIVKKHEEYYHRNKL